MRSFSLTFISSTAAKLNLTPFSVMLYNSFALYNSFVHAAGLQPPLPTYLSPFFQFFAQFSQNSLQLLPAEIFIPCLHLFSSGPVFNSALTSGQETIPGHLALTIFSSKLSHEKLQKDISVLGDWGIKM